MTKYLTPLRKFVVIAAILALVLPLSTAVQAQSPVKLRFTYGRATTSDPRRTTF